MPKIALATIMAPLKKEGEEVRIKEDNNNKDTQHSISEGKSFNFFFCV
jgi:hypothetical protein